MDSRRADSYLNRYDVIYLDMTAVIGEAGIKELVPYIPVKKDGSQSAISDFKEYTMIRPRRFGSFVGFSTREVKRLCEEYQCDFQKMKCWYDGYRFRDVGAVYNPNSVMEAVRNDDLLTLLIHLGYLAYDESTGRARIPNEEVRLEFAKTFREVNREDTIRRVRESGQPILDTVHGNAEAVAAQIERIPLCLHLWWN